MPSRFATELAARSPVLDDYFGEMLRIEPQSEGGEFLAEGADPDRPAYDIVGTFRPKTSLVPMRQTLGGSSADAVNVTASLDHFSFLKSVLGDPARWPRAGDRIVRTEEPGTPRFKVSRVFDDGLVRHGCVVVPV
jgi:hypothetical protein